MLAMAAVLAADVLLAKRYLPAVDSGRYGAGVVLAVLRLPLEHVDRLLMLSDHRLQILAIELIPAELPQPRQRVARVRLGPDGDGDALILGALDQWVKARRDQVAQHLERGVDALDHQHQGDREHQHGHVCGAQAEDDTQRQRYACGDDVHHDKFGDGVIVDITGIGDKAEARVRFRDAGEKTLLLSWAPLARV